MFFKARGEFDKIHGLQQMTWHDNHKIQASLALESLETLFDEIDYECWEGLD